MRSAAHAQAEYGCWSAAGHPLRIEYSLRVLEDICATAVDGLYRFRHGGVEVGGVLYGEMEEDTVRILEFRSLECEHAYGPRFVLSERDRARMRELLDGPRRDPQLRGLVPVGWYHSHTRTEIALSPRDLEIYNRYFPQAWQVALVLRPEFYGPARAGFFVRNADDSLQPEACAQEFVIARRRRNNPPVPIAEPELQPELDLEPAVEEPSRLEPAAEPEPVGNVQEPAPVVAGEPEPIEALPSFVQVQAPVARRWLWLAGAICLVALGGAAFQRYYQAPAGGQPLSLWVADLGGQLLIEWDRTARPLRQAQGGSLEIQDGAERMEIQMDGSRLREGSVDYVRHSEIVDVRLRVRLPGGGRTEEMIRFVGPPVKAARQDAASRDNEQLKAEVARLQGELERRDAQLRRLRAQLQPRPAQ